MTFDPVLVSTLALFLVSLGSAFLVALWVAIVIWTYRDIRARVRERTVHILAAFLVALLGLPGVLVYLILRPSRTLEEEYQQTLEEEVLLQSLGDPLLCPGCERHVREDWLICPSCQTRLRKPCHQCGRLMELAWTICPYCTTPVPGVRKEVDTVEEAVADLESAASKEGARPPIREEEATTN
ncbi:MAG: zinc ribbon domain-containing protein [Anaerolineales bacterium]|nr:zinc ribbon domain-containing protein [Anaerolineales bacterium]MDW8227941.1 zinc ribbon domain-containing protein [Anaerolineales bacterium]